MQATIDPTTASIDGVIQWLRNQRRSRPHSTLSELIDLSRASLSRLTDLACIDLIERRRLGQMFHVEDVLRDIPQLDSSDSARLDLIDAELCVQVELGLTIDMEDYRRRFPTLTPAIEALVKMERGTMTAGTDDCEMRLDIGLRGSGTTVGKSSALHRGNALERIDGESNANRTLVHSVQPPPWFIREQVLASGENSCLIRGRDSNANRSVGLKIIRLTLATTKREIDLLLEAVEASSRVRHPAWVTPEVAAIENQCLAVIRPWVFGTRWDQARRHSSPQTRLRDLARIGYALQSAHDTSTKTGHAAHGGLHMNNLLVDVNGQVQIIDSVACIQPSAGDAFGVSNAGGSTNPSMSMRHRRSDVRALCALLRVATCGDLATDIHFHKRVAIIDRLCQKFISQPDLPTACSELADAAMKLADGVAVDPGTPDLVANAKSFWRRFVRSPAKDHDSN